MGKHSAMVPRAIFFFLVLAAVVAQNEGSAGSVCCRSSEACRENLTPGISLVQVQYSKTIREKLVKSVSKEKPSGTEKSSTTEKPTGTTISPTTTEAKKDGEKDKKDDKKHDKKDKKKDDTKEEKKDDKKEEKKEDKKDEKKKETK